MIFNTKNYPKNDALQKVLTIADETNKLNIKNLLK